MLTINENPGHFTIRREIVGIGGDKPFWEPPYTPLTIEPRWITYYSFLQIAESRTWAEALDAALGYKARIARQTAELQASTNVRHRSGGKA